MKWGKIIMYGVVIAVIVLFWKTIMGFFQSIITKIMPATPPATATTNASVSAGSPVANSSGVA